MLKALINRFRLWKDNIEVPILAPMSKDNVVVITAYLNKGNVVVSYKGEVRTGHFTDKTLKKMFRADEERRKSAIQIFASCISQLLLSIK